MPMEWVRGKTIGHGSFASVSLAKTINPSSGSGSGSGSGFPNIIAVKSCGVSHSASLKHERIILEQLKDCPDIIRCFGDSVTVENNEKLYNVALEYASGGALSEKVRVPENQVRRYTNSILNGLEFIHRNGFVHCDIKLQNILLVNNGGKESIKIADFGLAKRAKTVSGDDELKYEIRGTPMYMSPETVTGGEQESPSDIWALGCLVTEMITGNPVWNCSDVGGLLMKIGVGAAIPEIPGKLSDDGKDFLGKCFLKDPRKRWTAEMLLEHPFIKTVVNDVNEETEGQNKNQISPRDPFGFLDWESEQSCNSMTAEEEFRLPEVLPETRLGQLLTEQKPNWSVSNSWVNVR